MLKRGSGAPRRWLLGGLLLGAAGAASHLLAAGCGGGGGAGETGGRSGATGGAATGGASGGGPGTGGETATGGVKGPGGAATGGKATGGASTGGAAATGGAGNAGGAGAGGRAGWTITFADEFEGAANESPDPKKWTYDVGGTGWGNNELEYYTNRKENAATDGQGHLVITLRAESYMGKMYTSARLKTQGLFSQTYGRFEIRAQIPRGQGIWPAFWMLGEDITSNPWPNCGEIDILENVGKEPAIDHGSLHGPGYSGGSPLTGQYKLPSGALADAFHLYAVEWEENVIRFYVDDNLYETRRNTDVPKNARWVYDHPFFMILNIAIGGPFPGSPDSTTQYPQTLTVDYVRVYKR